MGSKALQAMAVRPDSQSRPLACYLGWLFASLVVPCSEISELRYSDTQILRSSGRDPSASGSGKRERATRRRAPASCPKPYLLIPQ